jgi:hypothetical protein
MTVVVTFEDYTPAPRYDALPWTEVRIEESDAADGTWTLIDTIALSPLDADPENPASRDFTTELGTADELWYRVIFADADGDTSEASAAVQNVASSTPYATVDELFRLLKIANPTAAQTLAGERVLLAASGEIDSEIDLAADDDPLAGWQLALVEEVNLERAVELWRETPFGIVGIDSDIGGTHTARNTWERYAHKLAPLKSQWGLA